jgi:hypothetical protein
MPISTPPTTTFTTKAGDGPATVTVTGVRTGAQKLVTGMGVLPVLGGCFGVFGVAVGDQQRFNFVRSCVLAYNMNFHALLLSRSRWRNDNKYTLDTQRGFKVFHRSD